MLVWQVGVGSGNGAVVLVGTDIESDSSSSDPPGGAQASHAKGKKPHKAAKKNKRTKAEKSASRKAEKCPTGRACAARRTPMTAHANFLIAVANAIIGATVRPRVVPMPRKRRGKHRAYSGTVCAFIFCFGRAWGDMNLFEHSKITQQYFPHASTHSFHHIRPHPLPGWSHP